MRLVKTAFIALAVCSSAASGRVLHRLVNRASTDICANLANAPLTVNIGAIGSVTIGLINVCLCLSGISNFEATNIVALAAVEIAGEAATTTSLQALINGAAGHQTCAYPDQLGSQVCSASNVCGFTCKNGFTPTPASRPTDCTCPAPNIVCNGQCLSAAACPSALPVKRDLEHKRNVCAAGHTACGVYGTHAWECVDTKSDLESCGGCAIPLTFGSLKGIDCTAIQGVSDVSCVSGACVVARCLSGYTPSEDGSFCFRNADIEAALENSVLAAAYGLEHIPFTKRSE